jgi:hypothetical protein
MYIKLNLDFLFSVYVFIFKVFAVCVKMLGLKIDNNFELNLNIQLTINNVFLNKINIFLYLSLLIQNH